MCILTFYVTCVFISVTLLVSCELHLISLWSVCIFTYFLCDLCIYFSYAVGELWTPLTLSVKCVYIHLLSMWLVCLFQLRCWWAVTSSPSLWSVCIFTYFLHDSCILSVWFVYLFRLRCWWVVNSTYSLRELRVHHEVMNVFLCSTQLQLSGDHRHHQGSHTCSL